MNPGTSKFAGILTSRIKESEKTSLVLDFATINSDYSLLTNTFPIPLPKSDYTVCRGLALGTAGGVFGLTKDSQGHIHEIEVPERLSSLKPGDRVLVGWVGNEAVVIDVILPADRL